ncbi:MAG: UDP-N-acetylmuramate dehydrogenase [bacterium]
MQMGSREGLKIEENVALAPLTTFYIGGPARYMARVASVEGLREALAYAREKELKMLILGGGSNMLVGDDGFDGLVIKIEIAGVEIQKDIEEKESNKVILIAGAGESWDAVVARSVAEGLWGIENLSGIPGTVGGAVVQNIGAYGAAVSEVLEWVEVFDTKTGEVKKIENTACAFDYRESVFKHTSNFVVTRAAFALSRQAKPNLSYKDLAQRFSDGVAETRGSSAPTLVAIREAVLAIRRGKFPDLSVEGTAGSFFKNPILPKPEAEALKQKYPEMPLFAMPETAGVKVPLAFILDKVLGLKGFCVGGARLFENQPLVVAAAHGTRAQDIFDLKDVVMKKVFDETQIKIEPEVKIIL